MVSTVSRSVAQPGVRRLMWKIMDNTHIYSLSKNVGFAISVIKAKGEAINVSMTFWWEESYSLDKRSRSLDTHKAKRLSGAVN